MTFWKMPYEGWSPRWNGQDKQELLFFPQKRIPLCTDSPNTQNKTKTTLQSRTIWWMELVYLAKAICELYSSICGKEPNVTKFYKHAFAPGEMFFQTILMNSQFKNRIVNDNKRYVEFIDSHPRVLTIRDYDTLKQGGYFFARKFDPKIDSQILDAIDKNLDE